jgi:hypothetical protein
VPTLDRAAASRWAPASTSTRAAEEAAARVASVSARERRLHGMPGPGRVDARQRPSSPGVRARMPLRRGR